MADITSDLVVYYPFNSDRLNYATGTGVADTTNNGTTINNSIFKIGSGSLRASGQYLTMNNITTNANFFTSSTNGISFSVWINYISSGTYARVFDIGSPSSYTNNCFLYLLNGNTLYATVWMNGGRSEHIIGNFRDAGWKHIVWTLTYSAGTTSTWNIYVDGVFLKQVTNQFFPVSTGSSFIANSNYNIVSGGGDGYYNGYIDDFRVYQRVLSQADVTALYNYTPPPDITSNLVVYYPFNSDRLNYATGTGVADTTNNGTTISTVSPAIGTGSLALTAASSEYLQLDSNSIVRSTNFVGTNGLTFACWFKSNANGTWARIIDWGNGAASNNIFMYIIINNLGVGIYIGSNSTQYNNTDGVNYNNNQWYHVVWTITYSTTNQSTYTVYINGTQKYIQSNNSYYPTNIARNSSFIGRSNWSDPYWNGNIDEFRVYQRVLSQADVTALYNFTGSASPADNIPCFREGTKILCLHNGKEEYIQVEKLRRGTLVKTLLEGYVPIELIGRKTIRNPSHQDRIEDRLFHCSKEKYPELFEDLYITGHHSILVDELTEEQKKNTTIVLGKIFITEDRYRLLACLDERAEPFAEPGKYTIYHFALENDNNQWNYGVYANGLLVESCSKEHLELYSGMEII